MGGFRTLLADHRAGRLEVTETLTERLYDELRSIARLWFRRQPKDHTLQPTAVVHEALLRLVGARAEAEDRRHFIALAAQTMRQVLIDHARSRRSLRRGGRWTRVTLQETPDGDGGAALDVLAIDDALRRLGDLSPRQARVAELRFFGGLGVDDTAMMLGVSPRTVELDTRLARAWLRRELLEWSENDERSASRTGE